MNMNSICLGDRNKLDTIAHNIYAELRSCDENKYDVVLIESVIKEGIGIAIMNRLIRASGYNIVQC